jgi:hypothetical protein
MTDSGSFSNQLIYMHCECRTSPIERGCTTWNRPSQSLFPNQSISSNKTTEDIVHVTMQAANVKRQKKETTVVTNLRTLY